MARKWLGSGSEVARKWLGSGSEVARKWLGCGSGVARKWLGFGLRLTGALFDVFFVFSQKMVISLAKTRLFAEILAKII